MERLVLGVSCQTLRLCVAKLMASKPCSCLGVLP